MASANHLNLSPKLFTPQEAEALIPFLEENLARFQACRKRIRAARQELSVLHLMIASGGNDQNPDRLRCTALKTKLEEYERELDQVQRRVRRSGVVAKSFHQGLIDFFALSGDRLVFLCWKRGEARITHWHTLESGFQGRSPISQLQ